MARELQEINTEYSGICMRLGERIYQSAIVAQEIEALKVRCSELQKEGAEAVEAAKQASEVDAQVGEIANAKPSGAV
jgi:hypothetical protein